MPAASATSAVFESQQTTAAIFRPSRFIVCNAAGVSFAAVTRGAR